MLNNQVTRQISLFLFILIALLVGYYPALDAPFYLDDSASIVSNQVIRSFDLSRYAIAYPMREVGYLSFALNYHFSELNVFYYRVTNLLIHGLVSLSLFFFIHKLISLKTNEIASLKYLPHIALALFMVAALNSQPVIYVVQRLAIIAALFYLLALTSYLNFRTHIQLSKKLIWLFLVCLFAFLGFHTKQNIAVLPIAIVLLELTFFSFHFHKHVPKILVVIFTVFIFTTFVDYFFEMEMLSKVDALTRETYRITRWEYFTHQLSTVLMYQYKFILPYPLLLEYSSSVTTWDSPLTWLGLIIHLTAIAGAIKYLKYKPILSSLVLLYYISHLVESSIIPISDLTFEHRAYLPNLFLAGVFAYGLCTLMNNRFKTGTGLLLIVLLGNTYVLNTRSQQWADPRVMSRHDLTYVDDNARIYAQIAEQFLQDNKIRQAERWYQFAMTVGAETKHLQGDAVVNYIKLLTKYNFVGKANKYAVLGLNIIENPLEKAQIYNEMAKIKSSQGLCVAANNFTALAKKFGGQALTFETIPCEEKLY